MMIVLGNEEKRLKMTQFPKGGNMLMGKDNNKKMEQMTDNKTLDDGL